MKRLILIASSLLTFCFLNFVHADLLSASYVVPPLKPGETPTTLALTNVLYAEDEAKVQTLAFTLPEDLVGPDSAALVMKQVAGSANEPMNFVGNSVSTLCLSTAALTLECKMSYAPNGSYSAIGAQQVTAFLANKYSKQPEVLANKLRVAAEFGGDPEGTVILHFSNTGKQ